MFSKQDMIRLQAEKHELVVTKDFQTTEEYFLFLIHLKAYEEAVKMARDKTVLDLGCNNGYGTQIISHNCKEVIGVDVSPKAIEEARRRFGSIGIEFLLVDGKKLPFEDDKFDLVVSCQVIEHIVNYELYLSEIKRVLSPQGSAVFTTPNALVRLEPGMKPWNPFHVREFSAIELGELLHNFFPRVQVQGLFGEETLYLTEFNRLKRAREKARNRTNNTRTRLYYSMRKKGIEMLPQRMIEVVKTVRTLFKEKPKISVPEEYKPTETQYSTKDLFYLESNLEQALDLMAICYMDVEFPAD